MAAARKATTPTTPSLTEARDGRERPLRHRPRPHHGVCSGCMVAPGLARNAERAVVPRRTSSPKGNWIDPTNRKITFRQYVEVPAASRRDRW